MFWLKVVAPEDIDLFFCQLRVLFFSHDHADKVVVVIRFFAAVVWQGVDLFYHFNAGVGSVLQSVGFVDTARHVTVGVDRFDQFFKHIHGESSGYAYIIAAGKLVVIL